MKSSPVMNPDTRPGFSHRCSARSIASAVFRDERLQAFTERLKTARSQRDPDTARPPPMLTGGLTEALASAATLL